MKNFTKLMIAGICGASSMLPSSASAFQGDSQDGCYATEVVASNQGLTSNGAAVPANRSDVSKTLMSPDMSNAVGGFYSLGMGGSITLKFGGAVSNSDGNDIMIYETSYSGDTCGASDDETAMIEVSQDGSTWYNLGNICRDGGVDLDGLPVPFVTQIRITDMTTNNGDGYDVDGVVAIGGCEPVSDVDLCYGSSIVEGSFQQGLQKNNQPVAGNRSDATKALGAPELIYDPNTVTYVSLGYGGSIVITFDGVVYDAPGDDLAVAETTGNNAGATAPWVETAEVFVSQDNVIFHSVGFANKFELAQFDIADAGVGLTFIRSVKVVDVTPMSSISADAYDLDGIIALNGCSQDPSQDPEVCENFDYFVADRQQNGGILKIYAAKIIGGNAVLTMITSRDPEVSIAYDEANNVLYGINAAGTLIEKIDPINGASLGFVNIAPGFGNQVFSAVFKNGILYTASGSQNRVIAIDVTDGSFTEVVADLPINGGDLAFIGNDLYISTKDGDDLYKFVGGVAVNVGSVPANVHGVSATPDGNLAVIAKNSNAIQFLDTNGNVTNSVPATLDGQPFTFKDGDMTGGCNIPFNADPNPSECYVVDYMNYIEGTTKNGGEVAEIRTNPDMVLGEPEGTDDYVFTTLGYGGEITLTFGGAIPNVPGPDLFFVETSFNKPLGCETYPEYADVYVSLDNVTYYMAGTICKSEATIDISDAGVLDYVNFVKVVNNNEMSTTPDGFDLDGVVALGTCVDFNIEAFLAQQSSALLSANSLEARDLGFISYPNPTSGVSNVEFVAKTSGKVLIEVYDINGRNIAQVFNGNTFAGQQYKANFDGSNLASGLYIYKITTNNTSISEKFIISK
ncbi:T9SS type A sorting domain-containing protein [Subsaximicrobium wynnwilliamsii]|uniref:T9SS type A sorting domain-containing protein n=1 Tax=Subsaximicrobium wynnwilliamsii TaxID=291179 RepID=A0A5C6ZF11_9FLAO|nr:T9SS type A sorting domain-containing protein [Subsaximicrobium wynnwilliamsii]TXD82178.1 T9SS type A sorting domain-containing protein [Subsaximicrobium wynnwilliamsii]TXD87818.1 T9SS type A sorting domain-containing protein [Subsaximicrobium wynnwilliamsii]TXE01768.1 T9SS type A sorting domain-containing protein [Subsaximicrobium wynnwilliamsii]